MKSVLLLSLLLLPAWGKAESAPAPASPPADPWAAVRALEGEWTGEAEGEPGLGTVHRSYQFVLDHRFLHERNSSAYAPKPPAFRGELHEHWSFISFDKVRKRLVLRQFHEEGFINQYVAADETGAPGKLVFESESFENLGGNWRARETYEFSGADAFSEVFELAEPGKEFHVYSKTVFQRVKR